MKAVLRAFSRERVIQKRMPIDMGGRPVFCSPDALLSMWKPGWPDHAVQLFDWAHRYVKPGYVVWDIGANQGLFTFASAAAAGPSGHVVAFEPDPFLAGLMYRSRRTQQAETRVDILPVAVSGNPGVTTFCVASKDRALNHLAAVAGNPHTYGDRERFAVIAVTLEWVGENVPAPDLIKIDVEGAELAVLEHAGANLLHRVRPRWIIEVAPENNRTVGQILRGAKYRMFDADAPMNEVESPAWNTLAVPEEKCHAPWTA